MAYSLIDQKERIERELKNDNLSYTVREALQAQLASVNKKIVGKKQRAATLGDGTVVYIGDTVYKFWKGAFPSMGERGYYNVRELFMPRIQESTIHAINTDGRIAFSEYRPDYNSTKEFYATKDAAVKAAYIDMIKQIENAKADIERTKKNLQLALDNLPEVKAWAAENGLDQLGDQLGTVA